MRQLSVSRILLGLEAFYLRRADQTPTGRQTSPARVKASLNRASVIELEGEEGWARPGRPIVLQPFGTELRRIVGNLLGISGQPGHRALLMLFLRCCVLNDNIGGVCEICIQSVPSYFARLRRIFDFVLPSLSLFL